MAINTYAALSPDILLNPSPGCINLSSFSTLDSLIRSMFSSGEQGVAYDPNDLSTMWQDQAKLLPVTGEGQPVWHILDKSGNNNHAFAASSATRPILRKNATTGAYYLEFDGSDDFLQTNNINFTSTNKVSLFAGVRKLSDASRGIIVELGNGAAQPNLFNLNAPSSEGLNNFGFWSIGSLAVGRANTNNHVAPYSASISAKGSILQDYAEITVNGVKTIAPTTDQGTGSYGNYPLYIGRRAGTNLPFNGHIYGLIGIGKLTSDNETTVIEKELAKRVGVTLNV